VHTSTFIKAKKVLGNYPTDYLMRRIRLVLPLIAFSQNNRNKKKFSGVTSIGFEYDSNMNM